MVCDYDYLQKGLKIHVHHFQYEKWGVSILKSENVYFDVTLLCEEHHFKGEIPFWFLWLWRRERKLTQGKETRTLLWRFTKSLFVALLLSRHHPSR